MTTTAVDSKEFRNVIGHFMSGVTIISTHFDGVDYGMTASSVCSLSLEPPMVVVCLNRQIPTQTAVSNAGVFAVNILSEKQGWLAERFGSRRDDKFDAVEVVRGNSDVPVLAGSLAHLRCRVVEKVEAGTHTVFMAEVTEVFSDDGRPLAYYRGAFGRFELQQNAEAYAVLRRAVLDRSYDVDTPLDPLQLVDDLGLPIEAVHDALTRLVADGLVQRQSYGYVQQPYDIERTQNSFEVKRIIDLAAADLTVGRVTPEQIDELQRLCDEIAHQIDGDEILDIDQYQDASAAFQECLVGLTGNDMLIDTVRRLSIPSILTHVPGLRDTTPANMGRNRQELVEAYRAADLERVKVILNRQSDLVTSEWALVIEALGGKL